MAHINWQTKNLMYSTLSLNEGGTELGKKEGKMLVLQILLKAPGFLHLLFKKIFPI